MLFPRFSNLGAVLLATLALPIVARAGSYTFSTNQDGTASTLDSLTHGTAYTWGLTQSSLQSGASSTLAQLESGVANGSLSVTGATLTLTSAYDWTSESHDVLYVDILNNLTAGANSTTYMNEITNDTVYGDNPFDSSSTGVSEKSGTVTQSGHTGYSSSQIYYDLLTQSGSTHDAGSHASNGTGTAGNITFSGTATGADFTSAGSANLISYSEETANPGSSYNPSGDPGTFTAVSTTTPVTITYQLSPANLNLLNAMLKQDATSGQDLGLGLGPDCHFYDSGISLSLTTTPAGVPDNASTVAMLGCALVALWGMSRRRNRAAARG